MTNCNTRKYLYLIVTSLLLFSPFASAEIVNQAHTDVELISEVTGVVPGESFWVAVRMQTEKDWHVYWRNAGDSGMSPDVKWDLPPALKAGDLNWPYPEKLTLPPLTVYAYEGEILLLAELTASDHLEVGDNLELKAAFSWLACKVNCVPGDAKLSLTLPVVESGAASQTLQASKFKTARENLPFISEDWVVDVSLKADQLTFDLRNEGKEHALEALYFFPYASELIEHGAPQKLVKKTTGHYQLLIKRSDLEITHLKSIDGIMVSPNGWGRDSKANALEVSVLREGLAHSAAKPFLHLLFFAFLGGLILNLMPCVLPVLSLKVLNFAESAHKKNGHTFVHGLFFAVGIISTFMVLALILIILRSAGQAVGWGFQLQSPLFVFFLALVFFIFAINLLGVFEIGAALTRLGLITDHDTGNAGSFLNGVIATVVATPCTAPFMGTALGFGLTQSTPAALLIFFFLGLGMSFPYLILAAFPSLVVVIPKPGRWMIIFKRLLTIPLFLTVTWLVWVLSLQKGTDLLPLLIFGFVLLAFALYLHGRNQRGDTNKKGLEIGLFILSGLLLCGSLFFSGVNEQKHLGNRQSGVAWQTFSAEKLDALLSEGKPVFVDFTAAWCLSCQVNDHFALSSKDVADKFEELEVVALKADWTNKDEAIERALAKYGRNSIPLYVLYGPEKKNKPIILPEIITSQMVLDALEKAFR